MTMRRCILPVGCLLRLWLGAIVLVATSMPLSALEPEERKAVVVSGRVWEGYEYKETFLPSLEETLTLMAGADSALTYVRTLEYYWPLSRQVYVDFERQRDTVEGELVIESGGAEVAREALQPYAVLYPEGAVNGNGRLLWGAEAERAYAEHQEEQRRFSGEYAAALRERAAYERRLVESGAARDRDEPATPIEPPPASPKPSLRLVTKPSLGFRVNLGAGLYTMTLEKDGKPVASTQRRLRVVGPAAAAALVADVVPMERWTRPLATNIEAARIYVRPGTVFYMTVTEASHFPEDVYLPVVSPQAQPVAGRSIWIRRRPATVDRLQVAWSGNEARTLTRQPLKVEQTRGSAYGYRIRTANAGEQADLDAFTIEVPADSTVTRGRIAAAGEAPSAFFREVVIVHPRQSAFSLVLALLPLLGWAAAVGYRKIGGKRSGH